MLQSLGRNLSIHSLRHQFFVAVSLRVFFFFVIRLRRAGGHRKSRLYRGALPAGQVFGLKHTLPPIVFNLDEILPVSELFFLAECKRWGRLFEIWNRIVRSVPNMVKENPSVLFDYFWKHTGGRMT